MKLAYAQSNVVASEGVQTTSAFGIARTPHMFNILSSGLYSDKVAAVIREISCNAMDAHIMAGCPDKPFQLKLPTSLDRSFYVKDWGPGLDDREVRELYTTYGWSSKQTSDEVTGAFGLGSKSPFAYTMQNAEDSDGFTVVAVKDGVKRVYTCYIGNDGGPAISRLHEGPADADWQHGVMVTFPVQSRDITEFHQKAGEVLRWFKVKPEVLGLNGQLADPDFAFSGSFFHMRPQRADAYLHSSVVTGNVRYPINADRLGSLSAIEAALLRSDIVMYLPLGTVMMTPSREELQYTEATKANLREWLGKAALEVALRVRDDVMTPAENTWQWYRRIQQYAQTLPQGVQNALLEFLVAAGVSKEEAEDIRKVVNERTVEMPSWVGDGAEGPRGELRRDENGFVVRDASGQPIFDLPEDSRGCRVWRYEYDTEKSVVRRREVVRGRVRVGSDDEKVRLDVLKNTVFFYADGKAADARVRALVRESPDVDVAFLVGSCRGTSADYAKEYTEKVCGKAGLDGVPMQAVSSLEVPTSYVNKRQRSKELKELPPKELYGDETVEFLSARGRLSSTTIGELDEEADVFYLVRHEGQRRRGGFYRNFVGDEARYSFREYSADEVMTAVTRLMAHLNLPFRGAVVVPRESAARRLKFAEQGIQPLLPWLHKKLREDKQLLAELAAVPRKLPTVLLKDLWRADDYGLLGVLGHHAVKCSPFWQSLLQRVPASPLIPTVLDFVSAVGQSEGGVMPQDGARATLEAVKTLQERVDSLTAGEGLNLAVMSAWDVRCKTVELVPSLRAVDINAWTGMCDSDDDSEREYALAMLEFVLERDGLKGDEETAPQTLAWAA